MLACHAGGSGSFPDALFMTKPVLRVAVVIQSGSLENISLKVSGMEKRFLWKKLGTGCVRQV